MGERGGCRVRWRRFPVGSLQQANIARGGGISWNGWGVSGRAIFCPSQRCDPGNRPGCTQSLSGTGNRPAGPCRSGRGVAFSPSLTVHGSSAPRNSSAATELPGCAAAGTAVAVAASFFHSAGAAQSRVGGASGGMNEAGRSEARAGSPMAAQGCGDGEAGVGSRDRHRGDRGKTDRCPKELPKSWNPAWRHKGPPRDMN